MTVDQQQQQQPRVDETCTTLLKNPNNGRFWSRRVVTGDVKCVVFYRNAANMENVCMIKPAAQLTVHVVAKQDRLSQNVLLWMSGEISKKG